MLRSNKWLLLVSHFRAREVLVLIHPSGGQAKLPIPRLPRANPVTANTKRVTIKTPPSPEPSFSSASASPPSESPESFSSSMSQPSQPAAITGRAKTSHTTIERRYRTNLNARITGLKQAVPALRVLEPKSASEGYHDVVDSRGFVDGVKVARKMSKANILGKATEYIRYALRNDIYPILIIVQSSEEA